MTLTKKKIQQIMLSSGFLCLFFLFPLQTHALSLSPLRHLVVIDPGTSQTIELHVSNEEEHAIIVQPEIDAFSINPKTGAPEFGKANEAKQWIVSEQTEIRLAPQEEKTLSFRIFVPQEAKPGAHYIGLFAKQTGDIGQVSLGTRVGSLVYIHVAGEVTESLDISSFSHSFQENPYTPSFFVQFENTGDIHMMIDGHIELKNWKGTVVGKLPLTTTRPILSQSKWTDTLEGPPLTWQAIGPLDATLYTTYGVTKQQQTAALRFWYVPLSFLLIIGSIILIFIGSIFYIKRQSE